jgi:hypothetical protein
MTIKKKVAGIELRKTIGKNYHRWVAVLARQTVVFTPYLGRCNRKPFRWYASAHGPDAQLDQDRFGCLFHIEDNSLKQCVIAAQHEAHRRMAEIYKS